MKAISFKHQTTIIAEDQAQNLYSLLTKKK